MPEETFEERIIGYFASVGNKPMSLAELQPMLHAGGRNRRAFGKAVRNLERQGRIRADDTNEDGAGFYRWSAVETLVVHRKVYSANHESDAEAGHSHNCGKKQGEEACLVDQSYEVDRYPVGSIHFATASGPGVGHIKYKITRVDSEGSWGILLENTIRELSIEEVR